MRTLFFAILCVLAVGCGDAPVDDSKPGALDPSNADAGSTDDTSSDDEPDINPTGDAGDPTDAGSVDAESLETLASTFFQAHGCTNGYCHAAFALGSAESIYAAFVDVEAPTPLCGRTHYVVPGDPDQSILWLRIRPTTAEDIECEVPKMPSQRAEDLPTADTDLVRAWIEQGANP